MRFGISTVKRTISALFIGALLLVGMSTETLAKQGRGRNRADRGRHLGWEIGRHRGWNRRDDNWERRDRRRSLRRHWREERRDLRRHQRDERGDLLNVSDRDDRQEVRRHWRQERRELRQHQRSERNLYRNRRRG